MEESIFTNEPNQETTESSQLVTSLWEICQDIDNRPLLQKEQTAKSYEGMRINREPLNIDHIIVEDETFRILTIFPGEPYRPFLGGWGVSFEVKKDQYPELISAKKGLCLYVTGRIKSASENSIEIDETIIELK